MDEIIKYTNEKETTIKTINFSKKTGSKEIIILFEKHDEKNSKIREEGIKTALQVKNTKEAQKYHKKYDYLIGEAKRDLIESKKIILITNAETMIKKKDKTHYRLSGLNQVTAKIMKEKNKTYIFNLKNILESKEKDKIIGRMKQNKKILDKYKVPYKLMSFATKKTETRTKKEREHFMREL